jgi:hypothetical protein
MTRAMKVAPRVLPVVSRLCHITQALLKRALVGLLGGILGLIRHFPSAVVYDATCPPFAMPLRASRSPAPSRPGERRAAVVAHPGSPPRDNLALDDGDLRSLENTSRPEEVFIYSEHGQSYTDRDLPEKARISRLSLQWPNLRLGRLAHLFKVPSPASATCLPNNLNSITMIGCLGIILARGRRPMRRATVLLQIIAAFIAALPQSMGVARRMGPLF